MNPPPPVEEIEHHYAGVFIIAPDNKIIGQLRDDKPGIDNPGKVCTFGGTVEPDEDPKTAAWRELVKEETNLKLSLDDLKPVMDDVSWRELTIEWEVKHFFYARITDEQLADLEIYEGQGWTYIDSLNDPKLIDEWRGATEAMAKRLLND